MFKSLENLLYEEGSCCDMTRGNGCRLKEGRVKLDFFFLQ